mmetsp:Transcript_8318/g.19797  ORF Transcript_8318/g.19797 Transcript_8318/m.19797 type:complete len:328 (-) Transcript_8318:633-1616(-)
MLLPLLDGRQSLFVDLDGLPLHFPVDGFEIQVRVLIDQVEGPPSCVHAEGGHVEAVSGVRGWGTQWAGPIERQPHGAVGRVISEPCQAAASRARLQHVGVGCAEHGDRSLPLALEVWRVHWPAVGASVRSSSHALCKIVGSALVVVPQSVHDHGSGHRVLRGPHGGRVRILGLGQVPQVGVQLCALFGAQKAEDPPHAPAAVVGQEVPRAVQLARRRVVLVGLIAIGAEEVKVSWELGLGGLPPTHLLRQRCDAWAEEVVLRIIEIQAADGEGIPHRRHVVAREALGRPDGAGVVLARQHVEDPHISGLSIHHHQRLGAATVRGRVR